MSRKSIVNELQAEEAAVNSPVRRSSRIGGNGTSGSAVSARTPQTGESEAPKGIRTRRSSTQSNEDPIQAKKDLEVPKAVRTRRNSRASSEDPEIVGSKPNVTLRKKTKPEAQKVPARASVRRRNSATEEIKTEESKRKIEDIEESVPQQNNKTPGNSKEEGQLGELPKVDLRRSRRLSTDENVVNTPPVTSRRITRRSSISQEEEAVVQKPNEAKENDDAKKMLNSSTVKLTPIKKRKLVEIAESELDLSTIDESLGDINSSPNQTTDEVFKYSPKPAITTGNSPLKPDNPKSTESSSPVRKSPRLSEKVASSPQEITNKSDTPISPLAVPLDDLKQPTRQSLPGRKEDLEVANSSKQVELERLNPDTKIAEILSTPDGSDKENIVLELSATVPCKPPSQSPARVSNVFKPNQKEYSFVEPMEIDEWSFNGAVDSGAEPALGLDESSVIISKNIPKSNTSNSHTKADDSTDGDIDAFKDSSSIFNKKIAPDSTLTERLNDTETSLNNKTVEIALEGKKSVVNSPAEIKHYPLRKSSSPILIKNKVLRKSRSPLLANGNSVSENEGRSRLSVARLSKSNTPSPRYSGKSATMPKPRTSLSPISKTVAVAEQSFEKPMGSEEILIASEKISMKSSPKRTSLSKPTEVKNMEKTPTSKPVEGAEVAGLQESRNKKCTQYDFYLPSDDDMSEETEGPDSATKTQQEEMNDAERSRADESKSVDFIVQDDEIVEDTGRRCTRTTISAAIPRRESIALQNAAVSAVNQPEDAKRKSVELKTTDAETRISNEAMDRSVSLEKSADDEEEDIEVAEAATTSLSKQTTDSVTMQIADEDARVVESEVECAESNKESERPDSVHSSAEMLHEEAVPEPAKTPKSKSNNSEEVERDDTFLVDSEPETNNGSVDGNSGSDIELKIVLSDSNPGSPQSGSLCNLGGTSEMLSKENESVVKEIHEETVHVSIQGTEIEDEDCENAKTEVELNAEAGHIPTQGAEIEVDENSGTGLEIHAKDSHISPDETEIEHKDDENAKSSDTHEMEFEEECADECYSAPTVPLSTLKPNEEIDSGVGSKLEENESTSSTGSTPVIEQHTESASREAADNCEDEENAEDEPHLERRKSGQSKQEETQSKPQSPESSPGQKLNQSRRKSSDKQFEDDETENSGETIKIVSPEETSRNVTQLDSPASKPAKQSSKSPIPKPRKLSANAELKEYIKQKLDEIEDSSSEDSQSEVAYSEFIDGMAEEGEEDTPSEDSNAIPDEGESIGYSDSDEDDLDDEYDENDSFICDDEVTDLLSGDEYDLSNQVGTKKSKKLKLTYVDSLSNSDIEEKHVDKKRQKRSRIIEINDSSSEEEQEGIPPSPALNVKKDTPKGSKNLTAKAIPDNEGRLQKQDNVAENSEIVTDLSIENISIIDANSRVQKACKNSSLTIQENISPEGTSTQRINNLVESFCSAVKKGEISLNVSLDHEDVPNPARVEGEEANEPIHIISNIQIAPKNLAVEETEQLIKPESSTKSEMKRIKKKEKLKKRLSQSVSEMCTKFENVQEQEFSKVKRVRQRARLQRRLNKSANEASEKMGKSADPSCSSNSETERKIAKKQAKLKRKAKSNASEVIEEPEEQQFSAGSESENRARKKSKKQKKQSLTKKPSSELCEETPDLTEAEPCTSSQADAKDMQNRPRLKRRLSKSVSELIEEEQTQKRRKKNKKLKKASSFTALEEEAKRGEKDRKAHQLSGLKPGTFNLISQLITDVKNRPKRIIKPSTSTAADSSWIVSHTPTIKASTSSVSKREIVGVTTKLHPKDFKNFCLTDSKRVKKVDTKTLLKRKGSC